MLWYAMSGGRDSDRQARGGDGHGDPSRERDDGVILVAEDSLLNQNLMSAMLSRLGHRHHVVSNGAEAVDFVTGHGCALVLMDLQMPVMHGEAAAHAIRKLPRTAGSVPIVFVSGNPLDLEDACRRVPGTVGMLAKPFQLSELADAIAAHARTAEPTR